MAGIGLYVREYERLRREEGRSPADIRAVLDRPRIVVIADVEVVAGGGRRTATASSTSASAIEALAYEMADEFGVRYLQAIGPYECALDQARRRLRPDCATAPPSTACWSASSGCRTPTSPPPPTPRRSCAAADRPNGGYCADIWHHVRGANDLSMIAALEPDRIFAVQMNDGTLAPAARRLQGRLPGQPRAAG